MNIGENIRKYRKANNMGQKELAELLHISDKTVSSWEKGRTEPKMGMIENVAKVFNITKSELLNDAPYMTFNTPDEFELHWHQIGGGRHPLELTDAEYELILEYRNADDITKETINRLLKYGELLNGNR